MTFVDAPSTAGNPNARVSVRIEEADEDERVSYASEFDRFQDFATRLIRVPKGEMDPPSEHAR